jgi:predicted ATPase with chaperone activity
MYQDVSLTEIEVTSSRLLEMIESAYPNPLSVTEMAQYVSFIFVKIHELAIYNCMIFFRQTHSEKSKVFLLLSELQASGLVKTVNGNESFTRVVQNENKVKVVKQMPKIVKAKQPTIAIITSQYCEKLAVDAMMDDQETFVRYTTVGMYLSMI